MSLVRKLEKGALQAVADVVAPEAALVEEAFEVVDNLASGISAAKQIYEKGSAVVRGGRTAIQYVNKKLGGGPDRKATTVTQSLAHMQVDSRVPVAVNVKSKNSGPVMRSLPSGGMRIQHRELVDDIVGSVAWGEAHFMELNPGLPHCFPWLSSIAKSFQQYRAAGPIKIEYIPSLATTSSGALYLSPCYVADEDQPDTEAEAANLQGTVSGSVWAPLSLVLPVKALMAIGPRKFIRTDMEAGDLKTFDMGFLQASSVGCGGATTIGRLFVTYDFEFFNPIVSPTAGLSNAFGFAAFRGTNAGDIGLVAGAFYSLPTTVEWANGLRIRTLLVGSGYDYYLPRGRYLVTASSMVYNSTGSGSLTHTLRGSALSGSSPNRVDGLANINSDTFFSVSSVTSGFLPIEQQWIFEIFDTSFPISFAVRFNTGTGGNGFLTNSGNNFPKLVFQLL